jgi:hypothetical protein
MLGFRTFISSGLQASGSKFKLIDRVHACMMARSMGTSSFPGSFLFDRSDDSDQSTNFFFFLKTLDSHVVLLRFRLRAGAGPEPSHSGAESDGAGAGGSKASSSHGVVTPRVTSGHTAPAPVTPAPFSLFDTAPAEMGTLWTATRPATSTFPDALPH